MTLNTNEIKLSNILFRRIRTTDHIQSKEQEQPLDQSPLMKYFSRECTCIAAFARHSQFYFGVVGLSVLVQGDIFNLIKYKVSLYDSQHKWDQTLKYFI